MKRFLTVFLAVIVAAAALTGVCAAAGSLKPENGEIAYMRMAGIEGMARDAAHERWMEVIDYALDCVPGEDGTQQIRSVTFTHPVEPATTKIIDAYMKGRVIYDAELHVCVRACGAQHLILDVLLQKARIDKTEVIVLADGTVAETVTLTAENITRTEFPFDPFAA